MTKFDQFMELAAEMKVQIVKKCYAIPYVRLRRTCRFMDEFCEENRTKLGIYCYRRRPCLYLLNSLNVLPFKKNKQNKELDGVYVAINYGLNNGDSNFLVQMTSRNVTRIRRSLSGFAFTTISLVNISIENYEENRKFEQALIYFIEATVDLNSVQQLTMKNMTTEQVKMITSTWKVEKVNLLKSRNIGELMAIDGVKSAPYILFSLQGFSWKDDNMSNEQLIEEAVKGKKIVSLMLWGLPASKALPILDSVANNWKNDDNLLIFSMSFESVPRYYDLNISRRYASLWREGAVYLGCFSKFMRAVNNPATDFLAKQDKWDIWIKKFEGDKKWQIISVRRIPWQILTSIDIYSITATTRMHLILILIDMLDDICPGNAMDYSEFYKSLENVETTEEVRREFGKMTCFMTYFYSRIYTKPVVNVAYEMITEWWNGPRWILELTERKLIERRRPIIDLGYVLFQEVLCPVYQYCTIPNKQI